MSSLWQTVSENVVFVLEFLALIVVMFLIAYVIEKAVKKKNSDTERVLATRKIVVIGVFSAIAAILMVLEFPVPFAPSFYGLDFSELPALIGAFACPTRKSPMLTVIPSLARTGGGCHD